MLFPYPLESDLPVTIAVAATVVATATAICLFVVTMCLRVSTSMARRRREAVLDRWRSVFVHSMHSEQAAMCEPVRRYSRRDALDLLEEWNQFRATIDGQAARNLIQLAQRLGLDRVAGRLVRKRKLGTRLLAVRTLGYLGDRAHWETLVEHLDDPNTALSVTCAAALVHIDPAAAVPLVMPRVLGRPDWPRVTVAATLKAAGPQHITIPLCNAALTADVSTAVRLLEFSVHLRPEALERLVETVLRERSEPDVIAAALKVVPGVNGVPAIARFAQHDVWYVRMQAARVLGRSATERDLPILEQLLCDSEWWVRYRAAQAIVSLPFLGPNALRRLIARQTDRYAADMMHHAIAEVGL